MTDRLPDWPESPRNLPPRTPAENGDEIVRLGREVSGLRGDMTRLGGKVDHLSQAVETLTERLAPVEEHVTAEQREQRRREWAIEQGWRPPPAPGAAEGPPPTTQPPTLNPLQEDPRPRIWESEEGRKVINRSLAAAVLTALAIAGGLTWSDIRGEVTAFLVGPSVEVDARETLPDVGPPPESEPTGPAIDSPSAPRPNL